jgi:hypothetical protein
MMNSASKDNTSADIGTNVNKDKVLFSLCGAAIVFSLGRQVRVVLDDDEAIDNFIEHGAQGYRAPAFHGAYR